MKKSRGLLISILCLFFSSTSFSQEIEDKEKDESNFFEDYFVGAFMSDRPGQALAPRTVGALALQIQTGYQYKKSKSNLSYKTHLVPLDIRLGISPRFEINSSFYYQNDISISSNYFASEGFLSPNLGTRISLTRGYQWLPAIGIQASMSFASDKGDYQQTQMGSSFYIITSNKFDWFSINTNWGLRFSGNGSGQAIYSYVLNLGFSLNKKWSTFVELFGDFNNENSDLNLDAGIAYIPFKNFQLDVYGGLLDNSFYQEHWFIQAGLTYKFSLLKKIAEKDE